MSPTIIGVIRAVLWAAVLGAVAGVLDVVDVSSFGDVWWAPVAALVLRSLEGWRDKMRGQAPQLPPFGSRPVDAGAYLTPPEGHDA